MSSRFGLLGLSVGSTGHERGAEDVVPCAGTVHASDFVLRAFLTVEQELRKIGEKLGVAHGDAIARDETEEIGDGTANFGHGVEFAGDGGELVADLFEFGELHFFARVEEAERWVIGVAQHAALAAIGVGIVTEILRIERDAGSGGFC